VLTPRCAVKAGRSNRKHVQRLWREEGLRVPQRRRKRRRLGKSTVSADRLSARWCAARRRDPRSALGALVLYVFYLDAKSHTDWSPPGGTTKLGAWRPQALPPCAESRRPRLASETPELDDQRIRRSRSRPQRQVVPPDRGRNELAPRRAQFARQPPGRYLVDTEVDEAVLLIGVCSGQADAVQRLEEQGQRRSPWSVMPLSTELTLVMRRARRVIRSGSCPSAPDWSQARRQSAPWRARVGR
jgi:hypothetical protein